MTTDAPLPHWADEPGEASRADVTRAVFARNREVALSVIDQETLLRLTDAPVRDTRSRRLGIVEWSPGAGGFRVSQVPYQADMAVGDTLVNSSQRESFDQEFLPYHRIRAS